MCFGFDCNFDNYIGAILKFLIVIWKYGKYAPWHPEEGKAFSTLQDIVTYLSTYQKCSHSFKTLYRLSQEVFLSLNSQPFSISFLKKCFGKKMIFWCQRPVHSRTHGHHSLSWKTVSSHCKSVEFNLKESITGRLLAYKNANILWIQIHCTHLTPYVSIDYRVIEMLFKLRYCFRKYEHFLRKTVAKSRYLFLFWVILTSLNY